jgi:hypothetical protein
VLELKETRYKGIFDFLMDPVDKPRQGEYLRKEGEHLGSVIKKRRKKMRKHKHKKLLARSRHKRK